MAIATWQDLCIDAVDADRLGRFWAEVLGLTFVAHDDGDAQLDGPTPEHRVWINTVPEPVTVKQRVHLDVHAASVDDVLALGATPEDLDTFRWKVLRDPEGGELCVFEREPRRAGYRLYEIVVDSVDPHAIARWWADVARRHRTAREERGLAWVEEIPGAPFDCIVFGAVPEPKTVKNRIHWDVRTDDLALLTDAGATVLATAAALDRDGRPGGQRVLRVRPARGLMAGRAARAARRRTPPALRDWLKDNHASSDGVRLVLTKKGGTDTTLSWAQAVEELLCYGWIDGQAGKRDEGATRSGSRRAGHGACGPSATSSSSRSSSAAPDARAGRAAVEAAKADGRWAAAYAARTPRCRPTCSRRSRPSPRRSGCSTC